MRYQNVNKNKGNGVVYTPKEMAKYIAEEMLRYGIVPLEREISILDPAVGTGELLIAMGHIVSSYSKKIKIIGYEKDDQIGRETQKKLEHMFPKAIVEIRIKDFLEAIDQDEIGEYDYIIANPPYIRTQIMGSQYAQEISKKLLLKGRIDIYYAFLVCIKKYLKPTGVAGFITSNKFMTNKAGNTVRNFMIQNYLIHHIIDLGDTKTFSAAVLPCIIIFSLGNTLESDSVKFTSVYQVDDINSNQSIHELFDVIDENGIYKLSDGKSYQFQQGVLASIDLDSFWTISSHRKKLWLDKVKSKTWLNFSQIGKIRVGIKTTADNVFIKKVWEKEEANIELLRPLITHRNAGQIIANNNSQWKVLYTHTIKAGKKIAYNLDNYPCAKKYLLRYYDQLNERKYLKKANRNWYEIWVPQNPDSWSHRKIVFRDISKHPQFWLDETGAIVNGDCYWIDIFPEVKEEALYLALAVANSPFIEKYYDFRFNNKLYSGKRRYQAQYVEQFPIPYYDTELAHEAVSLVKKIIAGGHSAFACYKKELDLLVDKIFS